VEEARTLKEREMCCL